MTPRNMAILKLLAENASDYITIDRIADATGAGIRTIHRDLEGLERSLRIRGLRLERRRGYGIRLIDPLPEKMVRELAIPGPADRVDSGQRILLIYFYLVLFGDWVKLGSLASALFVSDSTVSIDLNGLESWLPESIRIDRQKGMGVRLHGAERDIRFLFLSTFPSLFPYYLIGTDSHGEGTDDRLLEALEISEMKESLNQRIADAEEGLGLRISFSHKGILFSYLVLMERRLAQSSYMEDTGGFRLVTPGIYRETAEKLLGRGNLHGNNWESILEHEKDVLARVLSACEVVSAPETPVSDYLGDLEPGIQSMIEHGLGRLEGKERIWLHDDRKFLNYLRLVISAAAYRIDLGISQWWEYRISPFPAVHETPESAVLVSQFLADLGSVLAEPEPAVVRREIQEGALAVAARLEEFRSRSASGLQVRILCYEGLGMSNYRLALAKDIFPAGTMFNNLWDPDFSDSPTAADYDLVITTYPLYVQGANMLKINGNDPPEMIRTTLRDASKNLAGDEHRKPARISHDLDSGRPQIEGPAIADALKVVDEFVVAEVDKSADIFRQAAEVLNRGDCDVDSLAGDFERRETYGKLVFDEIGIRILHCRSDAVPSPRAGVLQSGEGGETCLLLSAPVTAGQAETYALSEIVIALTEIPELPATLRRGTSEEIQTLLTRILGQKKP